MGKPVSFGFKMSWLAVRADEPESVIRTLQIDGSSQSGWEEGIARVYAADAMTERPVFVSPSLDGWVLLVSPVWFEEASDAEPERMVRFVTDTARRLQTEVQFFVTHRVVEGHAWARADSSGLQRAFYYLGEIGERLVDEGDLTACESELASLDPGADHPPDEETVIRVARGWSIDPTDLESTYSDVPDGLLGLLGRASDVRASPPSGGERPWWKFW